MKYSENKSISRYIIPLDSLKIPVRTHRSRESEIVTEEVVSSPKVGRKGFGEECLTDGEGS
jgi:hypothetical protein